MPALIQISLDGRPPRHPLAHGPGLHAWVLAAIEQRDAALSEELHDANLFKPFSIGPLLPAGRGALEVEIGVIADWLGDLIEDALAARDAHVRLGPQHYRVVGMRRLMEVSWDSLLGGSPSGAPALRWTVRCVTPTAHHAPGEFRKAIVLPAPETYFGSWFGRWNSAAPVAMDPSLMDVVARQVAVAECAGRTEPARLGTRVAIGFVGSVTFRVLRPERLPEQAAEAIGALARLAPFCGVGVETTRGMGKVRVEAG